MLKLILIDIFNPCICAQTRKAILKIPGQKISIGAAIPTVDTPNGDRNVRDTFHLVLQAQEQAIQNQNQCPEALTVDDLQMLKDLFATVEKGTTRGANVDATPKGPGANFVNKTIESDLEVTKAERPKDTDGRGSTATSKLAPLTNVLVPLENLVGANNFSTIISNQDVGNRKFSAANHKLGGENPDLLLNSAVSAPVTSSVFLLPNMQKRTMADSEVAMPETYIPGLQTFLQKSVPSHYGNGVASSDYAPRATSADEQLGAQGHVTSRSVKSIENCDNESNPMEKFLFSQDSKDGNEGHVDKLSALFATGTKDQPEEVDRNSSFLNDFGHILEKPDAARNKHGNVTNADATLDRDGETCGAFERLDKGGETAADSGCTDLLSEKSDASLSAVGLSPPVSVSDSVKVHLGSCDDSNTKLNEETVSEMQARLLKPAELEQMHILVKQALAESIHKQNTRRRRGDESSEENIRVIELQEQMRAILHERERLRSLEAIDENFASDGSGTAMSHVERFDINNNDSVVKTRRIETKNPISPMSPSELFALGEERLLASGERLISNAEFQSSGIIFVRFFQFFGAGPRRFLIRFEKHSDSVLSVDLFMS